MSVPTIMRRSAVLAAATLRIGGRRRQSVVMRRASITLPSRRSAPPRVAAASVGSDALMTAAGVSWGGCYGLSVVGVLDVPMRLDDYVSMAALPADVAADGCDAASIMSVEFGDAAMVIRGSVAADAMTLIFAAGADIMTAECDRSAAYRMVAGVRCGLSANDVAAIGCDRLSVGDMHMPAAWLAARRGVDRVGRYAAAIDAMSGAPVLVVDGVLTVGGRVVMLDDGREMHAMQAGDWRMLLARPLSDVSRALVLLAQDDAAAEDIESLRDRLNASIRGSRVVPVDAVPYADVLRYDISLRCELI